jgi:DNA-binding response OmpR family regulator
MTLFATPNFTQDILLPISITVHFYTLSQIRVSQTVTIHDGSSVTMTQTKTSASHKVLLVDDDDAVREMMSAMLQAKGFAVTLAASVTEALRLIVTEPFDVLITDLHMPNPSDGFAVITAMRHAQPKALTLLVSGYPDVKSAMDAILLEADDIIVKPFEAGKLAELVHDKLLSRKPAVLTPKERVASILQRCTSDVVEGWLAKVKKSKELNRVCLTDQERTGYLPKLIGDLIVRLRAPNVPGEFSDSLCSDAAVAHGKMRKLQGYTPAMLVHDSRILQVTLFGTLQKNLSALDFSLLLPDVMTIADEVDSQLTQAMDSYMGVVETAAA